MEEHVGGRLVHYACDGLGDIFVLDEGGQRVLTFDYTHEQSRMDLGRPHRLVHEHAQAMMMVLAFHEPRRALQLGLGGGCLLRALHYLRPRCEIESIELRARIHEIAGEFFGLPDSPQVRLTLADAGEALAKTPDTSRDLIFADMFHANCVAPLQRQQGFMGECHRVLDGRGWLVANYDGPADGDEPLFRWMGGLFPEILLCPIRDENHILFAGRQKLPADLGLFRQRVVGLEAEMEVALSPYFDRLIRLSQFA
ncbi:MAG: methyltransferase domain-containing protein [Gammaproteobacteria bacterium]|nr:methyltransferase domain-containing protein [Gammaproteobacteria bacterium]MBU1655124.1 methyltransferase domain-containing protein [Gammaproteobacteria bacterium]MBU1961596.1 methyltransferase domain-containing protein [Gammaproteobacteria bacterium]